MQEHRVDPWWFLRSTPSESVPHPSDSLQDALLDLLQHSPAHPPTEKPTSSSHSLPASPPLPPLLPYIQTLREMIQQLHEERVRVPDRVAAYSQRLFHVLQHLRHAFLSVEQEIRWLDPQHPLLSSLGALLQDIHHDIIQTQQFIQQIDPIASASSLTAKEDLLQPPYASHITPLYDHPPASSRLYDNPPPSFSQKEAQPITDKSVNDLPPPSPLSAEEIQQTLLTLQQTSKSGVRLNIVAPPSSAVHHTEPHFSSPPVVSEKLEPKPQPPSEAATSPRSETPESVQLFESLDPLRLSPPLKSSPKSKTKDIPAVIERISHRVDQVADTSSFRCAINELEQAKRAVPEDVWNDLCARLVQRAQEAYVEEKEWDKFNHCRSFLQKCSQPSFSQGSSQNTNEPPDSKYRGRFRDLLDDKFFSMYRKLVDDVCGTPMSYIDRHSPDERFHMLTIWAAQARWVQDQLPKDELGIQGFLRTIFGRINSARKEHLGHADYWINSLNPSFFADWPIFITEHEQRLLLVRQEQQAQQLVEAEREERAWQQEMRVYAWLSKLRNSIEALPSPASSEDPAVGAFLQVLREILEDEMNPSDTDLLELIDPYEELIQSGSEFRHLRRHLRKLKEQNPEYRDLLTPRESSLPTSANEATDEAYSYQLQRRRDAKKLRNLLPLVQDRNAAIIGGDEREQARERLHSMLRLKSLEWVPREGGNPRVLDRLEERISSGKVTLVLLLIRYCGHDTTRIIHACKRAGALWAPIDHGYGESRILHSLSYYLLEKDAPLEK